MRPEILSYNLLGATRSRAKMHEYSVPKEFYNTLVKNPNELFLLTIGILGDYGNEIDNEKHIIFSAQFFDALVESRLQEDIDNYLLLLGSAAYYLCNLPGSSSVLVSRISDLKMSDECDGLDIFLWEVLKSEGQLKLVHSSKNYQPFIIALQHIYNNFLESGHRSLHASGRCCLCSRPG